MANLHSDLTASGAEPTFWVEAPAGKPPALHAPVRIGAWTLAHRVVMAPFNRLLASSPGGVPSSDSLRHYAMRASVGGLIISEAIAVSLAGIAQAGTSGIFSAHQVNAWRGVTDEVHRRGGLMVAQLWHGGRLASPWLTGRPAVGASSIGFHGTVHAPSAKPAATPPPLALDDDGIDAVIEEYRRAAENAADAGFDGVELSCANGCLVDQFLEDGSNTRTDCYGGSVENRARFLVDVVQTLCSVWGASRVGVLLSPFGCLNGAADSAPEALFTHVLGTLRDEALAYVHVAEPRAGGGFGAMTESSSSLVVSRLRASYPGILLASGGFDLQGANAAIADGSADAIGFGRAFVANPDLPARLLTGEPLKSVDAACYFPAIADGTR